MIERGNCSAILHLFSFCFLFWYNVAISGQTTEMEGTGFPMGQTLTGLRLGTKKRYF
jgi:hypothetical protein